MRRCFASARRRATPCASAPVGTLGDHGGPTEPCCRWPATPPRPHRRSLPRRRPARRRPAAGHRLRRGRGRGARQAARSLRSLALGSCSWVSIRRRASSRSPTPATRRGHHRYLGGRRTRRRSSPWPVPTRAQRGTVLAPRAELQAEGAAVADERRREAGDVHRRARGFERRRGDHGHRRRRGAAARQPGWRRLDEHEHHPPAAVVGPRGADRHSTKAGKGGKLKLRLRCTTVGAARCAGSLTLKLGARKLTRAFSIAAGRRPLVTLKLGAGDRRRLARKRSLKSAVTVMTTQPDGTRRTTPGIAEAEATLVSRADAQSEASRRPTVNAP